MRRFLITASFGIALMIAGCLGDAAGPTDVDSPSLDRIKGCEFVVRFWRHQINLRIDIVEQREAQLSAHPDVPGLQKALTKAQTRLSDTLNQAEDEINDACG